MQVANFTASSYLLIGINEFNSTLGSITVETGVTNAGTGTGLTVASGNVTSAAGNQSVFFAAQMKAALAERSVGIPTLWHVDILERVLVHMRATAFGRSLYNCSKDLPKLNPPLGNALTPSTGNASFLASRTNFCIISEPSEKPSPG